MGLTAAYLEYIDRNIASTVGELTGRRMLELGNQHVLAKAIPEKTGKEYFTRRGAEHVSVDLNCLDGALPLDLTRPRQFKKWQGYFDVIVNSGTTEHVEPMAAQYECFQIIHDCLKVGGVAIHVVPDIDERNRYGAWIGHCNNYYSPDFFRMLAQDNNYELVSMEIIDGNVCASLRKQQEDSFMNDRERFVSQITRMEGGVIYPGINDNNRLLRVITTHCPRFTMLLTAVLRKLRLTGWIKRHLLRLH
jgi:SAM-dependent methyltransferase